jgi:thymidylate synthase (FAD)
MTANDIARELARIDLPLSTYTQWYWKIDLHNLLHFLTLRIDAHAQWEMQEYAKIIAGMLKCVAPLSYEAWVDYDVCGARLSRMELEAIRSLLQPDDNGLRGVSGHLDKDALDKLGLSSREIDEFLKKLGAQATITSHDLPLAQAKSAKFFSDRMEAASSHRTEPRET